MNSKKKELKNEYKQNHRQMGIWQIRNLVSEKVLVGASLNIQGIFNRHRFALNLGNHQNKTLQADWREFGSDSFAFEVLDELTPRSEPEYDYREDLTLLEDLWLEKLLPYGDRGYNEKKKGKEERLRMIVANRLANQ
jgi:hypothetical protein